MRGVYDKEGFAISDKVHHAHDAPTHEVEQIRGLYQQMLASWTARDPAALAALYRVLPLSVVDNSALQRAVGTHPW